MFSDRVKELIKKSRIVSFESWQDYPPEVVATFQAADDQGRYLSEEDIKKINHYLPSLSDSLAQGRILRDNVAEIVSKARSVVLAANPQITEPGGG
ncbi:MAG: phycobilisome protein, partial [Waterburya sp.]